MSSHETERLPDDLGPALLAEPGDDVALGCESALPFLTASGEFAGLEEPRSWTPPWPV